jgi:hypothetical protein
MTEDAHISPLLGDPIQLLKETLLSHRYAFNLDQGNADVLFNTAQVLTSLAEKLNESKTSDEAEGEEARRGSVEMLHEAVELFSSGLAKQEMEFEEFQALRAEVGDDAAAGQRPPADADVGDRDSEGSETWAAVVEPVTPSSLVESALAQLSSLTTLISISTPAESSTVARIAELAAGLIQRKLPGYMSLLPDDAEEKGHVAPPTSTFLSVATSTIHTRSTEPQPAHSKAAAAQEIQLASALFQAALADTEYRSRLSSAQDYSARLTSIFTTLTGGNEDQTTPPSFLCAHADALMDFASSLTDDGASETEAELTTLCWKSLSHADALLGTALAALLAPPRPAALAAPADAPRPPSIHLLRGDVSLLRRQLALLPAAAPSIASSAATLLHNAGAYYRGAATLAGREGARDADVGGEALIKAAMVRGMEEGLVGGRHAVEELFAGMELERVRVVVEDMLEEGLVEEGVREMLG